MNLHLVLHLLKTDWQRLRWLILATWALMFIAAWPALSFDTASFHVSGTEKSSLGTLNDEFVAELVALGQITPSRDWFFTIIGLLFSGFILFLAGSLGFHTRGWSEGRPTRARETIMAKLIGLLLFAVLPVVLLLGSLPLLKGFSWHEAMAAGRDALGILVPRLGGVLLFGALCGSWWSWLAGMFAASASFIILPLILQIRGGADWWSRPLEISHASFLTQLPLWIAVVILALLLVMVPRHVPAVRKIAIALAAILLACQGLRFIPPPSYSDYIASAPDWSDEVKPVLKNEILGGTMTEESRTIGLGHPPTTTRQTRLDIDLTLETEGLPKEAFATWTPAESSKLLSRGNVIGSTSEPLHGYRSFNSPEPALFDAVIAPGAKPLDWQETGYFATNEPEQFTVIEPGTYTEAELSMELKGYAYRMKKMVDVSLGSTVQAKAGEITLHIRRLDVERFMPVVDVCLIMKDGLPGEIRNLPSMNTSLGWTPVIYFPKTGEAIIPSTHHTETMRVAPGIIAVRRLFSSGWTDRRMVHKLQAYEGARFMLLDRELLATMKADIHTAPLPLYISTPSRTPNGEELPLPVDQRPDPATTDTLAFEKWMAISDDGNSDWSARNIADYVPRHLDRILMRTNNYTSSSTATARALIYACPESRKSEVIAALSRRGNRTETNWIPEIVTGRGWVEEAKPQILEMLAKGGIGRNPESQRMVVMLEDPQTYAALLETGAIDQHYKTISRLPGIEPALTKAVTASYHKARDGERSGSSRLSLYVMPASHGISAAFVDLLAEWKKVPEKDLQRESYQIRQVIILPGRGGDWKTVVRELTARTAEDFRYDKLARRWVPARTETP